MKKILPLLICLFIFQAFSVFAQSGNTGGEAAAENGGETNAENDDEEKAE